MTVDRDNNERPITPRMVSMSYKAKVIEVMIATPSDVAKERQVIGDIVYEWNFVHSEDKDLVLLPVGWESHAAPSMGDRPQAIINKQVLKNCDLLIAAFWTRLGTPTGNRPAVRLKRSKNI